MSRVVVLLAAGWLCLPACSSPRPTPSTPGTAPPAASALLPTPAHVEVRDGRYYPHGPVRIGAAAVGASHLQRALERLAHRWEVETGMSAQIVPAGGPADVVVHCAGDGTDFPSLDDDESYSLEVSAGGVQLSAPSPVGIIRATETLVQLVAIDGDRPFVPVIRVDDRPRFQWRGLLIDPSRHFLPVPVVERILEAMAVVKMNVLHFHLTDEPGFRAESLRFPNLHGQGASGQFYTQADLRHLVSYAAERGIRVLPEFDMPGHVTSWLSGYPELASLPGPYQVATSFGWRDPAFDPTREEVYSFIAAFLDEMAPIFPDAYWHIGGDEVGDKDWDTAAGIVAYKQAHDIRSNRDLQARFSERVRQMLVGHGKTMVGWEEVLNPAISGEVVVQSWHSPASLAAAAREGHRGISSAGYYLDQMMNAESLYAVEPSEAGLDATSAARVLGGEVCMWGELVDAGNVESRIWPLTAAVAERLWSPAGLTDVADLHRRLWRVSDQLERAGARHRAGPRAIVANIAGALAPSLASVIETMAPIPLGDRLGSYAYTTSSPLDRVVDAATADPPALQQLRNDVAQATDPQTGTVARARIRAALERWRADAARLAPLATQEPRVGEIAPLVTALDGLTQAGLDALDVLDSANPAPAAWRSQQEALLANADQTAAELHSLLSAQVRALVDAATSTR